jgi:hypothetical protein
MQRVVRLVTLADVHEHAEIGRGPLSPDDRGWTAAPLDAGDDVDHRSISVSARLDAVLEDGRRLLLLDDRGWTEALRGAGADRIDDLWAVTSERDIVETARVVVGPDEAFGARSRDDMESDHWNALAETLRVHGVVVDAGELRQLPHDVVLSDRLRARLGHSPGGA